MAGQKIWLRAETKPAEARSALTPTTCKALIDAGYDVTVERSTQRIFDDEEFSKQGGWEKVLSRWPRGKGTLLDLEFLTDDSGRRVAAFGWSAGYAGSALAVKNWAWQLTHPNETLPGEVPYANQDRLVESVKESLEAGKKVAGKAPKILVIGALGRCGSGAVQLAKDVGIPEANIIQWDMAETARGGPFKEISHEADIFVNCIYLSAKIPPFVNVESLSAPNRTLSVICDVSADTSNPLNPIPLYDITTTFDKPTVPVSGLEAGGPPLSVISIDHLPLLTLNDRANARVWKQAEQLFDEKVATLPKSLQA
ncbi:hypothetical protein N7519_002598 [Penicillium mononematosum]|uniref:uncharacterized protein n=1 Tax=Penicillium mononematosum TaxID=268346 RepID=UPI002548C793|nr:uncharacterized protein N7519_002598 [Penicillium mononematosum]KAJ6187690.1 hypothetical protein N7519_002598 [Penicillium mononematosum]